MPLVSSLYPLKKESNAKKWVKGNGVFTIIKKEALVQLFSWVFCEIFKNTFLTEHFRVTAFEGSDS